MFLLECLHETRQVNISGCDTLTGPYFYRWAAAAEKACLTASIIVSFFATGCGDTESGMPIAPGPTCSSPRLETDMDAVLVKTASEVDFSFSVERQDVFTEFKAQTGLFPTATYDLPSSSSPRLAGVRWPGRRLALWLRSLA